MLSRLNGFHLGLFGLFRLLLLTFSLSLLSVSYFGGSVLSQEVVIEKLRLIPDFIPKDLKITTLSGGLTNQVYKVENDGRQFVLRVSGEVPAHLQLNLENEYASTEAAGRMKIGPQVFFQDPQKGIMLIEFVKGRNLALADLDDDSIVSQVGHIMRTIHGGPSMKREFDPFAAIRRYHQTALKNKVALPEGSDQALAVMERIERLLKEEWKIPRRPCHNDVHGLNLILDDGGRVHVIDWDYAGMGDVYFDLGIIASNYNFNEKISQKLLASYLQVKEGEASELPEREKARFELGVLMANLWNAFWFFSQEGESKIEFDFHKDGMRFYRQFEEGLRKLKNLKNVENLNI